MFKGLLTLIVSLESCKVGWCYYPHDTGGKTEAEWFVETQPPRVQVRFQLRRCWKQTPNKSWAVGVVPFLCFFELKQSPGYSLSLEFVL